MSQIKNFEDLKLERIRLEALAVLHRQELRSEISLLKDQFKPFSILARWLSGTHENLKTPIAEGAKVGIDLLVRDNLLSKSNWLIRSIVPFVLKNIVNIIGRNKRHSPAESQD